MARARNIKPGFFSNDQLAELAPLTRLLFAGLWTIADRQGRLEDRPKKIKAEILPYDTGNVDKMLDDLAARKFLIRYVVGGIKYLQVVSFTKHQNPHKNEANSTIPAPDEHPISTVQEPAKNGTNRADSLLLIPDSLNPIKPLRFAPPEWIPEEPWKAWLEVRRRIKAPNTDYALKLAVGDLERLRDAGDDPKAVLEKAIARGWKAFYPLSNAAAAPDYSRLAEQIPD